MIGMIFECQKGGPDIEVCKIFASRLVPGIKVDSVPMDNKLKLVRNCGNAAAALLASGCERVMIIWDLYPAWGMRNQKPCLHEDREGIFESLHEAGVDRDRVDLVCIHNMLETWLISDNRAIATVLRVEPRFISPPKFSGRLIDPKDDMKRIFRNHNGPYEDFKHAKKIAQAFKDLKSLYGCTCFRRFAKMLIGRPITREDLVC